MSLYLSRYKTYSAALLDERPPGPPHWLSKQLCQFCGGDDEDIANLLPLSQFFTNAVITNRKLIEEIMKKFGVVE